MRLILSRWKANLLILVIFCGLIYYFKSPTKTCNVIPGPSSLSNPSNYLVHPVVGKDGQVRTYSRKDAFIFIGGMPRSGTTLARAILDAHPSVRCGEETRVVPRILQMRSHWAKSEKETMRLNEAGVYKEVLDSSIAAFIIEVIAKHGEPAERLCNKDPFTMKSAVYLSELFPNGKFLFMVRDGRATVHSIITRKVTITGFDLNSYEASMKKWNQAIEAMYKECKEAGSSRCMMVYYEQLVLHPKDTMEKVLSFLDLPWDDAVLHHEELINKPGGISLSKVERSSDQVIKPINLEALTKWVGNIPEDVVKKMAEIAPMLKKLGYDPNANPPKYGDPDAFVEKNTLDIKKDESKWLNKTKSLLSEKAADPA